MILSELNEGTNATLYFPRFSGDEVEFDRGAENAEILRGQETILIVEDESILLRLLRMQLATLGYRVFAASEGEAALAILRERTDIDLLFCDIVLPGELNGREIADAAQAIRPAIKVLFTSGYSQDVIMQKERLDPKAELLSKPYRLSELAEKIRSVLDF